MEARVLRSEHEFYMKWYQTPIFTKIRQINFIREKELRKFSRYMHVLQREVARHRQLLRMSSAWLGRIQSRTQQILLELDNINKFARSRVDILQRQLANCEIDRSSAADACKRNTEAMLKNISLMNQRKFAYCRKTMLLIKSAQSTIPF